MAVCSSAGCIGYCMAEQNGFDCIDSSGFAGNFVNCDMGDVKSKLFDDEVDVGDG